MYINNISLGITKFADYSQEEFRALLGYQKKYSVLDKKLVDIPPYKGGRKSVDWTGVYTTPIKGML